MFGSAALDLDQIFWLPHAAIPCRMVFLGLLLALDVCPAGSLTGKRSSASSIPPQAWSSEPYPRMASSSLLPNDFVPILVQDPLHLCSAKEYHPIIRLHVMYWHPDVFHACCRSGVTAGLKSIRTASQSHQDRTIAISLPRRVEALVLRSLPCVWTQQAHFAPARGFQVPVIVSRLSNAFLHGDSQSGRESD